VNINIKIIAHSEQTYNTVGNWFYDQDGTLEIRVSKMNDWRYESLVVVHELVEVLLCKHSGVTQQEVDRFDKRFEARRKPGNFDEPGDDEKAPYRVQHCVATGVERIVAALLGVSWSEYEAKINSL
jgi:hypothetical protein